MAWWHCLTLGRASRRKQHPASAWQAGQRKAGSSNKIRPVTALSSKACLDFWTPPQDWMLACLDTQRGARQSPSALSKANLVLSIICALSAHECAVNHLAEYLGLP